MQAEQKTDGQTVETAILIAPDDSAELSDDTLNNMMDRTFELLSIKEQQDAFKHEIEKLDAQKKKLWRQFYSLKARGEELQMKIQHARKKRKQAP